MRFNINELISLSQEIPDWEGKLFYIPPEKSSQSSLIKSGARSAAKLGNGLVKSIAGVSTAANGQTNSLAKTANNVNDGRERWFRIKANLLFYFKLTPEKRKPTLPGTEPLGVLVLEHFHFQKEGFEEVTRQTIGKNQFSLIFADEPDKKHFFIAENQQRVSQWETVLKQASYQILRERLLDLQIKLRHKTGEDPLEGSSLQINPMFSSKHLLNSNYRALEQKPSDFGINSMSKAKVQPVTKIIPPPRSKKKTKKQTFQSHIVNDWESLSPIVVASEATEDIFLDQINDGAASFKSHLSNEPEVDNLIQF